MPNFTAEDVRRLARLARLDLTDSEVEVFARQLGDILLFARQVESVDTQALPPPAAPAAGTALRSDDARESLRRDDALAGAPDGDRATGLFKVPRVLNG